MGAGVAAGLAHPPFGVLPGLLGYALMMRMAETTGARPRRSAFFRGWLAGVGYFAVGVWWITEAFLVDAAAHGWMAPFALLFMAGGLALFWGLAALLYRIADVRGPGRVLVFAGALALLEWVRSHIFTGFPWNLPGESWTAGGAVSQVASLIGPYALSWVTIALAASFALALDAGSPRRRFAGPLLAALVLAGMFAFGTVRLSTAPPVRADAPMVRIVQADIDQKDKWKPENLDAIVEAYVELSRGKPGDPVPQIIVWPEGALPAVIDDLLAPGSPYVARFAQAVAPGQTLLLGANRVQFDAQGQPDYFNSLVALRGEPEGLKVTGVYDKHRLVPFGEFLPFGDLATRLGIRSLVHMPEDFTAGPAPRPISPQGLPPLQPLICYEALFPRFAEAAATRAGLRPQWLLNVSNDAWFGATSGPWQHLNIASYRAIESGLPIIRATPTGVSAVIDAQGRIVPGAELGLGKTGVIDARLPAPRARTIYSVISEAGFAMMLLLSLAMVGFRQLHRRIERN
ncbi:apolipoprotein N-acyltransferase [Phenylobacterium sp. NIBR 498073]|uniref:apolipoprotein N-acyltransferase n=1 Tax=Phenylobacterium sp. NIBR 498073 TaxID=3015177 RepID=UPI0022B4BA0A|nr:apolipoprotein N-acyltransferase [Phenylobacterium sp. NIBR 498073]WGU42268.1 apolipoprotein N-acyltransferase [Phenylobacterium sp. NIBR 498073]